MKKLLIIFLLLVVVLPVAGQNDGIIKKPAFKNQIDLDVEFLGVSTSYQRRIAKKWMIGPSFGLGWSLHPVYACNGFDESNFAREVAHIGIMLNYYLNTKIQFEIEPRYALIIQDIDSDYGAGSIFGTSIGIFYGEFVQIGIRPMIGYFKSGLFLSSSLLIIRIPMKW